LTSDLAAAILAALLAALAPALSRPLAGQYLVPDEPTCGSCRIDVTGVVTLRDSAAAHMPGSPLAVVVDALGRYWLTYPGGETLPLVYRPDGSLARELGPRGDGPGEHQRPALVLPLPGDSVLVFDPRRGGYAILSSDLVVRRRVLQPSYDLPLAVLEWPAMVLTIGGSNVDVVNGEPVYQYGDFSVVNLSDTQARRLSSFPGLFSPRVAPGGSFSVWIWDYTPYRIELRTSTGELRNALERRPSLFPEERHPRPLPGQLPPAHLVGAQQDAEGLLWVFVNEPHTIWSPGGPFPPDEMERYFRTRVEVIDPANHRIVATSQVDGVIVSPLPGQRAAIYGTNVQGTPFVRIVQLRLLR
jgi:hypothetical protein